MHHTSESTPVLFHPALAFVGLIWGAGNVLTEVARGAPSLLSVLGPILIGAAAVGSLLFNIYRYARQRAAVLRILHAQIAALKAEIERSNASRPRS